MKNEVTCSECGKKKMTFIDLQDLKGSKWKILGMDVGANLPIVLCDTCERSSPGGTIVFNRSRKRNSVPDKAEIEELENL